jgi:hypothetical protein
MSDLPPDSNRDTDDEIGTPRWVKAFGVVIVAVVLLFVILHLAGGGPGIH